MFQKSSIILAALLFASAALKAQDRFFTKTGTIQFYSKAALEDIEAKNRTVTAVLDTKTGALQFSVQMRGFEFQKALMQEHFNENYVESDKYPKGEFKGAIGNNNVISYDKEGTYNATVKGKLSLHGVTKDIETPAVIKVSGGKIEGNASFSILLSDYNISIPSVVKDKVSNSIKITIATTLEPLKG